MPQIFRVSRDKIPLKTLSLDLVENEPAEWEQYEGLMNPKQWMQIGVRVGEQQNRCALKNTTQIGCLNCLHLGNPLPQTGIAVHDRALPWDIALRRPWGIWLPTPHSDNFCTWCAAAPMKMRRDKHQVDALWGTADSFNLGMVGTAAHACRGCCSAAGLLHGLHGGVLLHMPAVT